MALQFIICRHCGLVGEKEAGAITRAKNAGLNLYCSRKCAGLGRRQNKTDAEKKEAKRLYDIKYRKENAGRIRADKAKWFRRTYDPEKAAVDRKKRMAAHVEYCRRPEYRAWKKAYDRTHKAKKGYGEFWECQVLLLGLDDEISARADRYDVYAENGTLNKALRRKRDYEKTHRQESEGRPLGNLE